MSFGEEVKNLREAAGMTQKQLADKVGVSQPIIGRLEKSESGGVQGSTLFALAAALGVSCEHFAKFFPASSSPTVPLSAEAKPAKNKGKKK